MSTKSRFKIIINSKITKMIIAIFSVAAIILVIVLPSVLTARPNSSLLAFNRDYTSGTREAFVEKVLEEDPDDYTPGSNVLEASNNESMIRAVTNNPYSISYVSFGTVADFDENGNPEMKERFDKIDFASFNGVVPTKDIIQSGEYNAARNFNAFFRVEEGSDEAEILNYNWETESFDSSYSEQTIINLTDDSVGDVESFKASYMFYSWMLYSSEAEDTLNESGIAIPVQNDKFYFYEENDSTGEVVTNKYETYIDAAAMSTDEEIRIEIIGSSSATETIKILSEEFELEFESLYPSSDIEFIIANNGSGDAFKETVPGVVNPYIGLQSREAKETELSNWGWTEDTNAYNPFSIDAILILFNTTKIEYTGMLNTTTEAMNNLYSNDEYYYYDDLLSPLNPDDTMEVK